MLVRGVVLLFMVTAALAGRWTGVVTDSSKQYAALNQDIELVDRTSLVAVIKGCEGAQLTFYQYVGGGSFVHIRIGDNSNAYSLILASTLCDATAGCSVGTSANGTHLGCDDFKMFWFRWDNKGKFEVGFNGIPGSEPMMDMDYNVNNDGDFKLRTLEVTSGTAGQDVQFYFYIDLPPEMITPAPGGGTVVTFSEDTSVGTQVLTTNATDPEGDTVTFSVVDNYTDIFAWNNAGHYFINGSLDYDQHPVYYVKLSASDGVNVVANTLTVLVTDVDDETPVVTSSVPEVMEELPVGMGVYGVYSLSDPDSTDFTYAISGADQSLFTISTSGVLTLTQRIDREAKSTLSLTVEVTDAAAHTGTADLTLTVLDANDQHPSCDKVIYTLSVAEGTTDENVKLLNAMGCVDIDTSTTSTNLQPAIVSGDTSNVFYYTGFELHGSPKLMDYESLSGSNFRYYLTIHVTDQQTAWPIMTGTVFVFAEVTSANEHDPTWTSPTPTSGNFPEITIAEDKNHDTAILTYVASDADLGTDGVVYYEIESVTTDAGATVTGKFNLDRENGELRVSDNLDVDADTGGSAYYDVVVKAVDGGGTPKSIQATQRIKLSNVNDNGPQFQNPPLEVSVAEDAAIGDVVHDLTVTDADGDGVTLSLSDGATTVFAITGTGLTTAAALDFETEKCFRIVVSVTDNTFTTLLPLTVRVTNTMDSAPTILVNSDLKIFEELPVGTVLSGLYTVSDPDVGDTFTYSVSGTDASYFNMGISGNLEIAQLMKFAETDFNVDITATDSGGNSVIESVTITTKDINDVAPECTPSLYEVTVEEQSGANMKILDPITCTDTDGGNNAVMIANITAGDPDGVFSFSGFELWGTPDNIDFESLASSNYKYTLRVQVQDQPDEGPPLSDNAVIIVTVTGKNEHTPSLLSPPVDSASKFPDVSLPEDASPGTLVVNVTATDADHGTDGDVTYEIAVTTDAGTSVTNKFWVGKHTGLVFVGETLDYDTDTGGVPYYVMEVKAIDGGTTALTATGTMTLSITGVNDNAPVISVNHDVEMSESSAVGDVVADVIVSDADGDTVTLTLAGDNSAMFSVSGTQILLNSPLDYDNKAKACLSVKVIASDGTHTAMDTFTLSVLAGNDEAPVILVGVDPKIQEELPTGSAVRGIYTVSDPDDGDSLTYQLSGAGSAYFSVSGAGELTMSSRLDREAVGDTTDITLQVTDAAAHVTSVTITVTIVDINDNAPRCDQHVYTVQLQEGSSSSDQKIMNAIPCTDADSGANANMAASVTSGDSGALFTFKGMELWGKADQVDYEALSGEEYQYSLTVHVVDQPSGVAALTGTAVINVQVTGKNEYSPGFTSPTLDGSGYFPGITKSENIVPGTALVTVAASDTDHGVDGDVMYAIDSITDDNGQSVTGVFSIDAQSGILRLQKHLDADPSTGGSTFYDIVINAVDKGSPAKTAQGTQKITLTSVNDNTPVFTDASLKKLLAENSNVGDTVGSMGANDGDGDSVTVSVTGANAAVFEGHATQPDILTKTAVDYETKKCYSVEVSATDGSGTSKTTLTIEITDVADVAPTLTPYSVINMAEELPYGTVIGQPFQIADLDTTDSHTYTISGTDASKFAVNLTSGRVFVTDNIDADTGTTSVAFTITATDSASLTGDANINLNVIDINEHSPAFDKTVYTATVEENSSKAKIHDVVCTDNDAGVNGNVEFVIPTTNNADNIFSVTGTELFADGTLLDYDSLESSGFVYSFTLMCRDKPTTSEPKTGSVLVSIQVTGVNEHAPVFSSPLLDSSNTFPEVSVPETFSPGDAILTFTVTDGDKGGDGTITYGIKSVLSATSADASGKFLIDPGTGVLTPTSSLDFDTTTGGTAYYDIEISATDNTTEITGTQRLILTDVSDNAPEFSKKLYNIDIPCSTLVDSTLETLEANDADSVGSSVFSFVDYAGDKFALNSGSGSLVLKTPTFYVGEDIHHIFTVQVTDSEDPSMMDQSIVNVVFEYCGPSNATTPAGPTTTTVCIPVTDDSGLMPMRAVAAVLGVGLVGFIGFTIGRVVSYLRPPATKKVAPNPLKRKGRVFERPLASENSILYDDMVHKGVDNGLFYSPEVWAEEATKFHPVKY